MNYQFKETTFNLDILVLTKAQTRAMRPVTKLNIFVSSSDNFEEDGLFSTEIFGASGSEARNTTFSYIDLGVSVLHPLVYKHISTLKAFYKDVIEGKKYAVYDEKLKDLVLSTPTEGRTGYSFFIETLNKIEMLENDSDLRRFKILMISRYGTPEYMLSQFLVLPAGLRDYRIGSNGVPEEDEINDMYRKLLTLASSISNLTLNKDTLPAIDTVRYRIQEAILDIYQHIMTLLDGKKKFLQGKWGARGILYGTRNVITPSIANIVDLDDPNNLSIEQTTCGLYQYAIAITPITMNRLHAVFISKLFNPDDNYAYLVNPKSMRSELVNISMKERDRWLTPDGLNEMLSNLGQEDLRKEPVMVDGKYLLLLLDTGKTIEVIYNTDELPEDFNPKQLRPITYYELLYIALMDTFALYRGLITRYPVINLGGIYPSKLYIKATSNPRKVVVKLGVKELETSEYPNLKESYYNSLSPHYAYLAALGGDHDGDKVSLTVLYTDDSIKEIDKLMNTKEFYLSPDNRLVFSPRTGTLNYVVAAMNKGVIYE